MEFNKEKKCKICGWEGKTHLHHIIPLRLFGDDSEDNLIELCPNHHSEACGNNEKQFAVKYNLKGKKMSDEKYSDLREASLIFVKEDLTPDEKSRLMEITEKYNFDKYDYTAIIMGVTRQRIITLEAQL